MNIKEVFEKCNDGDFVIDNNNKKWKVDKWNDKCDLTNEYYFIYNYYTLTELLDLDFKKVYDVDWSKVEVDTKILVSSDDIKWYRRYFAKYENGKVYAYPNGATSFTYDCREVLPWKYVKLYEEVENEY